MRASNYVVKANRLNEATSNQSMQTMKCVLVFVAMINARGKKLDPYYRISLRQMAYFLNLIGSGSYKEQLIRALKKVAKNPIMLNRNLLVSWFSSVQFLPDGQIEVEFSRKLESYLLNMKKNFTMYRLYNVLRLKSKHSIRVYELLVQYKVIKERTFELQDLRNKLGIPPGSYLNWKDFKKRILQVAKKELKEETDLGFNIIPESKRKGKAVTHVRFTIYSVQRQRSREFFEQLEALETAKHIIKKDYQIPNNSDNSPNFDKVYQGFINSRENFPESMSFEMYVQDLGAKVVQKGSGKDLYFLSPKELDLVH